MCLMNPSRSDSGFNPMGWDCEKQGCFNKKKRPKIEVFHDLFPGRISMGDVDGIVEVNGNIMMMEWKAEGVELPIGQRVLFERLSGRLGVTVFVVAGDAETMDVQDFSIYVGGERFAPDEPHGMPALREWIGRWVAGASKQPGEDTKRKRSCLSGFVVVKPKEALCE